MVNTKIKLLLVLLLTSFSFVSNANAFTNAKKYVSNISYCEYKVEGDVIDGTTFDTGWKALSVPSCDNTIDFDTLGVPNGIFNLHFRAGDNTISPAKNVMPDTIKGVYRIDTVPVKCVLNSIELHGMNNQYYNNGRLYYKNGSTAAGKFVLDITCTDTTAANIGKTCDDGNGTQVSCVSGINETYFPTLLGVSSPTAVFSKQTPEETKVKLTYNWSGNYNDAFDILNNATFVSDKAGNLSPLINSNTSLLFKDINGVTTIATIPNIPSLILTPDSTAPLVNNNTFSTSNLLTTQGLEFKSGNTGVGSYLNIYDGVTTSAKPFSALDNRVIKTPSFTDNGSGLRNFGFSIEKHDNKNAKKDYPQYIGSDLNNNKVTTIPSQTFTHNFSDVSGIVDGGGFYLDYDTNGYRLYDWNVKSYLKDGNIVLDRICDMVNNCVQMYTPDLIVVANEPDLTKTTHDVQNLYTGKVGNDSDEYKLNITYKDKYNNEIVPVAGIKEIKFTNNFENTLGVDQINNPSSGNGVEFRFTDGNSDPIFFNNDSNTKLTRTVTNRAQLDDGVLNIAIKSAVPTKVEYSTATNNPGAQNVSIYGDILTAKLNFTDFKIDVIDLTGNNGVGNFITTGNSFIGLLPDFRFKPLITFDYIGNIFPLVEGQFKDMLIKNTVNDFAELSAFDLNIKTSTNNDFIQVSKSNLKDNNLSFGTWSTVNKLNEYDIIDNGSSLSYGYGTMNYSNEDTFQILPQTIGGLINDNTKIALFSELSYTTTNGKNVLLPGIQTGFNNFGIHNDTDFSVDSLYNPDSSIIFSEIKITGITQSNNVTGNTAGEGAITTDNSTFNDFSKITLLDLKTNIHRNLSVLLKGEDLTKATVGSSDIVINDFSNFNNSQGLVLQGSDVLYVKDRNVIVNCGNTCSIPGKKTIIVENGNLTINSDMYYEDANSILGIVLVGNTSSGDKSQLKINEKITNGVGIVYAEGPIVSVNSAGVIYDGSNVGENLVNQLYWKGSYMTRNTVGGSILDLDIRTSCPYGTPDYEQVTCTQESAQAYDLIYLRRYARVNEETYYGSINHPMGDNKVPLHYNLQDVKIAGGITITSNGFMNSGDINLTSASTEYNAPLIIDYDSRIQSNPPYVSLQ